MWCNVTDSVVAMKTYLQLRKQYGKELMCEPGDVATTLGMVKDGKITVAVEVEKNAFAMVMLDRGGEIAVCGVGHGQECIAKAEEMASDRGIRVVNAWVHQHNGGSRNAFELADYYSIGPKDRDGEWGEYYAKALR